MKKRILALCLTLAMLFSTASILSTVAFAEDEAPAAVSATAALSPVAANDAEALEAAETVELASGITFKAIWSLEAKTLNIVDLTIDGYKAIAIKFAGRTLNLTIADGAVTVAGIEGATATAADGKATVIVPLASVYVDPDTNKSDITITATAADDTATTDEVSLGYGLVFGTPDVDEVISSVHNQGYAPAPAGTGKYENQVLTFDTTNTADTRLYFSYANGDTIYDLKHKEKADLGTIYSSVTLNFEKFDAVAAADAHVQREAKDWPMDRVNYTLFRKSGEHDKDKIGMQFSIIRTIPEGGTEADATFVLYFYTTDNSHLKVDTGKKLGEDINLTVKQTYSDKTVEIIVDDKATKLDNVQIVEGQGYVSPASIAVQFCEVYADTGSVIKFTASNYKTGVQIKYGDEDAKKVEMADFMALVAATPSDPKEKVSVDVVAASQDGLEYGEYKFINKVMADATYNKVNVTENVKASFHWSFKQEMFYIAYGVTGADKITTKIGDATLVLDITSADGAYAVTASGIDGAAAELNTTTNYALVSIPLSELYLTDAADAAVLKAEITAEKDGLVYEGEANVTLDLGLYTAINRFDVTHSSPADNKQWQLQINSSLYGWAIDAINNVGYDIDDLQLDHFYNVQSLPAVSLDAAEKHTFTTGENGSTSNYNTVNNEGNNRGLPSRIFTTVFLPTGLEGEKEGALKGTNFVGSNGASDCHLVCYYIYNVSPVDANGNITESTDDDSLYLVVGDKSTDMTKADKINLGVKVGEEFTLSYRIIFAEDIKASTLEILVNGEVVGTSNYPLFIFNVETSKIEDLGLNAAGWATWTGRYCMFVVLCDAVDADVVSLHATGAEMTANTEFAYDLDEVKALFAVDLPDEDLPTVEGIELYAVQSTAADAENYKQRLVAIMDQGDYFFAGFQYALADGETKVNLEEKGYYTSIISDEINCIAAEDEAVVVSTIDGGIEKNGSFHVRAYVVDMEGNISYSDTYLVTYTDGVFTSATLVEDPADDLFAELVVDLPGEPEEPEDPEEPVEGGLEVGGDNTEGGFDGADSAVG